MQQKIAIPSLLLSYLLVASLSAGAWVSSASAQETNQPVNSVQIIGLAGVKENTRGTLVVGNAKLHFAYGKKSFDLSASSIVEVSTGADSQPAVGKTISTVSTAAPYGGGRVIALFRTKIDTLTIQYRDTSGGLHGAIFTLPAGTAETIKRELTSEGAHTGTGAVASTPAFVSLRKDEK